jgi:hypothetical protein
VAVIAGIVSLPALLGSDKPPPVPPDVGLTPTPATVAAPAVEELPNKAPTAGPGGRGKFFRHTRKNSPRRRSSRGQRHERTHRSARHSHARQGNSERTYAPPSLPVFSPPVYSYVPPPTPGEFQIER